MPRVAIVLNNPKLTVATTLAGIATGDAVECQITSATLTPQPVYNTIPATGCTGQSQSPGLTGWQLDLNWLQDWSADPSLSQFAYDNDGKVVFYELTLDSVGLPEFKASGSAYSRVRGDRRHVRRRIRRGVRSSHLAMPGQADHHADHRHARRRRR